MWWHTVQIGSLIFPQWTSVYEIVPFEQVQSILHTSPFKYLVVVNSLNLEEVKGVILRTDVDALIQRSESDKKLDHVPINKITDLISTDYEWLPISGGVIGDIDKVLKAGCSCIILYRTSQILTLTVEKNPVTNNNTDEGDYRLVEKKHPVAVVNESDIKSWIAQVEGHHNINEYESS